MSSSRKDGKRGGGHREAANRELQGKRPGVAPHCTPRGRSNKKQTLAVERARAKQEHGHEDARGSRPSTPEQENTMSRSRRDGRGGGVESYRDSRYDGPSASLSGRTGHTPGAPFHPPGQCSRSLQRLGGRRS